jgi:hypothetical protein
MFLKASGFRLWYFQKYLLKRITRKYLYRNKFSSFENKTTATQNYFGIANIKLFTQY